MRDSGEFHSSHVDPFVYLNRAHAAIYATAILALFYHHTLSLLTSTTFLSFSLSLTLFIADVVFTFQWFLAQAFRWRPVYRQVFPERLAEKVDRKDFPALDVFICTADPYKEPPLGVVNTALSVMAYDYPTDKLSVYVSDDGGSELTLFAFMEAARFARYWLPYCRENEIQERCPEAYFQSCGGGPSSEKINILYEKMKEKVESVMEAGRVDDELIISEEEREALKKWDINFTRQEHPSVIQVLLQSSYDTDITDHPLPNLVYISREKSRFSPHHFKAGALNVLVRVSNAMTIGPVILTVDCDMISNDPKTPHRALCYLGDKDLAGKLAFVQFPQRFGGINRDDIYGSEIKRLFQINPLGMDAGTGPNYVGSGAFFSRHALHGSLPLGSRNLPLSSKEVLDRAHQVASCTYEHGTKWGLTMGFRYGSLVEDYFTGYCLHCEGWESVFCDPERPAFLGNVPITLHDALSQVKRWTIGLLEVTISNYCPLTYGVKKASLLTGMCYAHYAFWAFWSIPMFVYGILPQILLLNQVPFFPKASDPWVFLYLYLFLAAYGQDLVDFLRAKGSLGRWWSDQRITMIRGVTCFPLGCMEFALKHLGFSASGFNVTSKLMDGDQKERYEKGILDFGVASLFLVSLGIFAIMSFTSFAVGLARALGDGIVGDLAVQLFISGFVVANSWPLYEAMVFRKDGGRVPRKCIMVSVLVTGVLHTIGYGILEIGGIFQGKT